MPLNINSFLTFIIIYNTSLYNYFNNCLMSTKCQINATKIKINLVLHNVYVNIKKEFVWI